MLRYLPELKHQVLELSYSIVVAKNAAVSCATVLLLVLLGKSWSGQDSIKQGSHFRIQSNIIRLVPELVFQVWIRFLRMTQKKLNSTKMAKLTGKMKCCVFLLIACINVHFVNIAEKFANVRIASWSGKMQGCPLEWGQRRDVYFGFLQQKLYHLYFAFVSRKVKSVPGVRAFAVKICNKILLNLDVQKVLNKL